jgi:serine/threonine protein phosphatase PrpC
MTKIRAAALSDIGKVRTRNEDRCLLDDQALVFGVADGVGGMPFGGEAAQAAHDTIRSAFQTPPEEEEPDLVDVVQRANRAVAALGRSVSPEKGIATTLTLGSFRNGQATIAHVGDSRAYAWHRGEFSQLTNDHTVEREAIRRHGLTELLQLSFADRHALTRCLGMTEPLEVDLVIRPLLPHDRYLFCTDGLTNHVRDNEISVIVYQAKSPEAALKELISLALQRGGSDNVSGVAVFVD